MCMDTASTRMNSAIDQMGCPPSSQDDGNHSDDDDPDPQFARRADGWRPGHLEIPTPMTGFKCPEEEAPKFEVKNFRTRSLVPILRTAFSSLGSLHYTPFQLLWNNPKRPDDPQTRCKVRYTTPLLTLKSFGT